jgi:hypothetical protein
MSLPSDGFLRRSAWVVPVGLIVMTALAVMIFFGGGEEATVNEALDAVGFWVVIMMFPLMGLLILRRQPRNTMGWLLQGVGMVWCVGAFADNYARYGLMVNPGSLPGPDVAAAINGGIWAPALGLMGTFVLLLYPDGHLPSPHWRLVAWLSAATVLSLTATLYLTPGELELSPVPGLENPLGWEAARAELNNLLGVLLALLPVCILACAAGLVRRFRRSRGTERLQLKWLATAAAGVAVLFLCAMLLPLVMPDSARPWLAVLDRLSFLSFALLPAAIGVAILRHRLYDIDLVINRALVYGTLTATLASTYLGSVLLLQLLLDPLTSQSDLAVAGSTLAVAALFRPARARIQGSVDRRFYRSRYDAARTLDAFAASLRHQLDLDAVGTDLRTAVTDTVQPAHVSLWLRP